MVNKVSSLLGGEQVNFLRHFHPFYRQEVDESGVNVT